MTALALVLGGVGLLFLWAGVTGQSIKGELLVALRGKA